jgi:hypothetical protein
VAAPLRFPQLAGADIGGGIVVIDDASKPYLTRDRASLSIDKISAAQEQLDESIGAFFRDKRLAAITLAGATEYMLPIVNPKSDLFEMGKKKISHLLGMSEAEVIDVMNEQRDWLKHVQMQKPVVMHYSQDDVVIIILRAYLRLRSFTEVESEEMLNFRYWIEQNYDSKNTLLFDQLHGGKI